ncbi:putative uba ts-n domain-containing protein [Golovinomyces cichoracearum]|uniref:Putative uba ts-n domain-containing protein n=1 Tax=Golovinomyces cichoracearum TaxID=62708 RepID=A0A420ICK5_9PEZI|nr:putative uba ts-n domain-containing protein [Golovinomyces cichoracearum]
MSGPLSKRQQARNERILQDLIKTVPGNNVCADCQVRNPGWASWSLGIFLCMRCAALHRKMGTHITKVKSLSMDTWTYDQVETMKRIGNIASNSIYNPLNTKAPINFDADDIDSSMEKFIRQKYQDKVIKASKESSAASLNSDDLPPPLPPKTGTSFGVRSSSSTFPFSVKHIKEVAQKSDKNFIPNLKRNKPSRVFGVNMEEANDYDPKSSKFYDTDFSEKRNLTVLKKMEGNLEKSIETLVCLGENETRKTKQKEMSYLPISDGANVSVGSSVDRSSLNSKNSGNPFDLLGPGNITAQPLSSQSTGRLQQGQINNDSGQQALGFNTASSASFQSSCDPHQASQNMFNKSLSLFPNRTGPGFPGAQVIHPEQNQQHTTPVPILPQQHDAHLISQYMSQLSLKTSNSNPFFQDLGQKQLNKNNDNNNSLNFYNNRHLTSLDLQQYPVQQPVPLNRIPSQYPPDTLSYPGQQPLESFNSFPNEINPYFSEPFSHPPDIQQRALQTELDILRSSNQPYVNIKQDNLSMQMFKSKVDTRSILDLYNRPDLAPGRPISGQTQHLTRSPRACSSEQTNLQSSPVNFTTNSKNPFASDILPSNSHLKGEFSSVLKTSQNTSHESNNLDTGGWMSGRHSPEAWRSISARSMR